MRRLPLTGNLGPQAILLLIGLLASMSAVANADMAPNAIVGVTGMAFHQGDNADPGDGSLSRIFDGSGLTIGDAGDPSTWTHNSRWQDNWQGQGAFTNSETPGGWLVADLGAVRDDLAKLYAWNVREVLDRGIQDVDVYVASSPTALPVTGSPYDFSSGGWTALGAQTLPQATGADTAADAVLDLTGISGRYFGFNLKTNYGSTFRTGVAELQFTTVPEPSSIVLGMLGLAIFGRFRRRSV
ncbi:MAG: PEP-CTERM sorting domain-containing protein [Pirellulaceae bacterium]|nr:PEP-CTERM sorting domain-containing protein [Planctomycetales bacterium]